VRIFLLPPSFTGEDRVEITGKEYHYLINVLRLKEGMQLTGRDGQGVYYTLTVSSVGTSKVLLETEVQLEGARETIDLFSSFRGPFPAVHLYQCVGKGKKLEQIIRQCTELGLSSITPVMSRYTLSDVTKNWNVKSQRYRKVAEQAIQQSASPVMTKIEEPVRIQDIASRVDDLSRLLVFHQSLENSPATIFSLTRDLIEEAPHSPISLLVGPEGGFSDEEVSALLDSGAKGILLQTNILRTETAAVTASAIIMQFAIDTLSHT